MKSTLAVALLLSWPLVSLSGCSRSEGHSVDEEAGAEDRLVVATSPVVKDVVSTEQYVCQIHSCRHIEVRALETGYLEEIRVKEGQEVKQGDVLFKIAPTLYQAKLDSEIAEVRLAQIELENTERLFANRVVSDREVALAKAKLAKAQAQLSLAQAELNFTELRAPFDGIMDRLHEQQGSLIEEGDMLTSLSDNSVMWVYFNVPEARYLEYQAGLAEADDAESGRMRIELVLANGETFPYPGTIGAIEADFNNETGNIAFRADFPNPDRLLRHGQTGNVLIHRTLPHAVVIPQRATFDVLDKRYVFIVDENDVAHQREITISHEMEDVYVVADGVQAGDRIILEGVRQVRDGQTVECEFRDPQDVLRELKFRAE